MKRHLKDIYRRNGKGQPSNAPTATIAMPKVQSKDFIKPVEDISADSDEDNDQDGDDGNNVPLNGTLVKLARVGDEEAEKLAKQLFAKIGVKVATTVYKNREYTSIGALSSKLAMKESERSVLNKTVSTHAASLSQYGLIQVTNKAEIQGVLDSLNITSRGKTTSLKLLPLPLAYIMICSIAGVGSDLARVEIDLPTSYRFMSVAAAAGMKIAPTVPYVKKGSTVASLVPSKPKTASLDKEADTPSANPTEVTVPEVAVTVEGKSSSVNITALSEIESVRTSLIEKKRGMEEEIQKIDAKISAINTALDLLKEVWC